MSEQPLTSKSVLEDVREMLRESSRQFSIQLKEQGAEFDRRMKKTDKKISQLGSRIGDMIEHMVCGKGNIVKKFRALDYEIHRYGPNVVFVNYDLKIRGEIDLFLENGDTAILVEVKTTLEIADVRKHMEQLEDFRRYANARGDRRRFIGAVAGAVVKDKVIDFAHANGMYVIVQSGKAFDIVEQPEGFQIKEW